MEDTIKKVETKIPIEKILFQTTLQSPKTECEFNNMLVYNAVKMIFEGLELEINQMTFGGKKKIKTHKNRKLKHKNKLTRYKRKVMKQKGGATTQFIIFLIGVLLVLVKGITNTTDIEIIQRINQIEDVSDLFANYYGTCTLNTMLFLKTIDLPTFEDLSINMMTTKPGLSSTEMLPYLNKELDIKGEWTEIHPNPQIEINKEYIKDYINKLKEKMISMRLKYGFKTDQSIITAMIYPVKNIKKSHAVILWLTSLNELILIDPQLFKLYGLMLYGYDLTRRQLNKNKSSTIYSLQYYVEKNINIDKTDDYIVLFPTKILTSLHLEINDIYGKNELSLKNKNVQNIIQKIKEIDKKLYIEPSNSFRQML